MFGGIAVTDFTAAYGWYKRLFGRPPDMLPHDQEAVWRLTSGGAVYVVGDPERAGKCLVTLAVADLEAHVSRLRAEGLAFTEEAEGPAPRRLAIRDDDGNKITFFQDPTLPAG
jgi:catechol 2,3-dioxygenase-like lactoylglutathione lyase family enzyme